MTNFDNGKIVIEGIPIEAIQAVVQEIELSPWEIVYTSDALKSMACLSKPLLYDSIKKLRSLAQGYRSARTAKLLEGCEVMNLREGLIINFISIDQISNVETIQLILAKDFESSGMLISSFQQLEIATVKLLKCGISLIMMVSPA